MKRFFHIFAALALCAALTACGSLNLPAATSAPAVSEAVPTGTPVPTETPVPEFRVTITEVMASNSGFITDGCGAFPDWIEIRNDGSAAVDLTGASVSTASGTAEITGGTVQPGEYCVIWCGSGTAEPHADVSIEKDGDTVTLFTPWGEAADSVTFEACSKNTSLIAGDGTVAESSYPTPGYENTDAGYEAYMQSLSADGLVLSEAVVYNNSLAAPDGEYYDWVELKNAGPSAVSLNGIYLSDDAKEPALYALPDATLQPGETYLVYLSDETTGFALSSQGDVLYLSDSNGTLLDHLLLRDIPDGCSYGRAQNGGYCYFTVTTPGAENSDGYRMLTATPSAGTPEGVYEDVSSVSVSLTGTGTIHYTLDGSLPTEESPVYEAPLELTETSVIRAVCTEEGKLTGEPLNLSYIINEGHTLPVTSLIIDPDDMFSKSTGLYYNPSQDIEKEGSITFFDGDSSFSIDCGVKLHGATSKYAQSKKSMKITFRNRYDGKLEYDLFGNGITEYSGVILRAAQESSYSTHIRDILFHELAQQCSDSLPTQDYKYTILYINGEYWGIYAYREAYSAEMYAAHYGYDADQVTMYKESWSANSEIVSLYNYILNHDMSNADNYAYVTAHLDVENLITWTIIESYSGNLDINPPNIRFFWSEEDQVMRYALVDLDLTSFTYANFDLSLYTGYVYSLIPRLLLQNAEFKQLMAEKLSEYLHGPLSDANVTSVIDGLAAELRPEIARDADRWGAYSLSVWENGLQGDLYRLSAESYHHAKIFASSAAGYLGLSSAEREQYFGDLP